jgi:regulator of sigma E protease
MILLTILIFIAILGLLVFVHELGHFVMAKRAGMRVDEFGFGFPPRIFGVKRGETTYSINLIPLGGFVKIMGEDGSENPDPSNFSNKSFLQRFGVLVAGVTMNVVLAWVLISIAMGIGAPTVVDQNTQLPASAIVEPSAVGVLEVATESPAQSAGVKAGDLILKINGQEVSSIQEVQNLTKERAGQVTAYTIKRGQDVLEISMTPRANPPAGQGALGIVPGEIAKVSYPWYEAPWRGLISTIGLIGFTLSAFWGLIEGLFQGANVGAALSGPVGIAVLTRDVAQLGLVYLMQFTAVLSVNLAIINIIPFPALDGGRILFLVIEKLRGKKMNAKAEVWFNTVGFVLLLTLMAGVTIHDFDKFNIISRIKNLF